MRYTALNFATVSIRQGQVVEGVVVAGLVVAGVVASRVVDEQLGIEAAPSTAARPVLSELFTDKLFPL